MADISYSCHLAKQFYICKQIMPEIVSDIFVHVQRLFAGEQIFEVSTGGTFCYGASSQCYIANLRILLSFTPINHANLDQKISGHNLYCVILYTEYVAIICNFTPIKHQI